MQELLLPIFRTILITLINILCRGCQSESSQEFHLSKNFFHAAGTEKDIPSEPVQETSPLILRLLPTVR